MAFSDYKHIYQVQTDYQIEYQEDNFLIIAEYNPSNQIIAELEFNQKNIDIFSSEAARCETIIFPILREVYQNYAEKTALWIQKSIAYDEKLNGTPDYMISKRSPLGKTMLELPLFIIVEAKKNDFEQGWGQCLAELVAVKNMNGRDKQSIYGIVTDGKLWEFGKLVDKIFSKNSDSFILNELSKLLGALKFIFDEVTKEIV
ncbi:hypothetical protein THII_3774 [Thioploca ingrica]|uniref:Type I restriction enzyme R protein N-terminal domain-containing protein n=1 Tax=Thioploca ingrica TaxID=40754 RepID=A0A090BW66_9GAMM|nr:hypothetical protein THII_3774 [Thioploca ingrica]